MSWRQDYSDSIRSLYTNKRGKAVSIDVKATLALWPNEARIRYRLKSQGIGMERLLLQHEKEVAEFISLVESVNLNVAPDLSSVITATTDTQADADRNERNRRNRYNYGGPPWDDEIFDATTQVSAAERDLRDSPEGEAELSFNNDGSYRGRRRSRRKSTKIEEKQEDKTEAPLPLHQPDRLTLQCERLVKAAISKDNVFQLVVAVSNHSMTVSNECLRYIARYTTLRKNTNEIQQLRPDVRAEVEKYLATVPRVRRRGTKFSPKLRDEDRERRYGEMPGPNEKPTLAAFEDVHVVLPLPPRDEGESDEAHVLAINTRVARMIDILYEKKYYPAGLHDNGRYYGPGESDTLVEFVCTSTEERLLTSSLIDKLHVDARKKAEAQIANSYEIKDIADCNITGRQRDGTDRRYGPTKKKIVAQYYSPIMYEFNMRVAYEVLPKK